MPGCPCHSLTGQLTKRCPAARLCTVPTIQSTETPTGVLSGGHLWPNSHALVASDRSLNCLQCMGSFKTEVKLCRARWPSGLERWTGDRTVRGSNPIAENFSLRNFGNSVYPALPVSFGGDTKSRRSLLSGVYARGSKRPHQSAVARERFFNRVVKRGV